MALYNEDCIAGAKNHIPDQLVNLGIYDPPFGINEGNFGKHYKRNEDYVIAGYQEAPNNYEEFTYNWLQEAHRILHKDGSMYIFMGHSNLRLLLNTTHSLGFKEINHCIWKFNFGVNATKKYITSHYHMLYLAKTAESQVTFNTHCRFGSQERDNGSLLYKDLEDVFCFNKDFAAGKTKNMNKLPLALIQKLILYSSKPNDMVCDFFMGNFTTAYASLGLGRNVCGFEVNKSAYDHHMNVIKDVEFGCDLKNLKKVENIEPVNKGKTITVEERKSICLDYQMWLKEGWKKKDINEKLQGKYQRGRFAIKNILDQQ